MSVLLLYVLVSAIALIWLGWRLLPLHARRKNRFVFGSWPVKTVSLGSFDPVFSATEFGPGLDSEVHFISQGDKPAVGGTSDLETWVLSVLAKHRNIIFEFGAYFHRFRPVVFIETGHPCSRKPASRFHDFGHPFSSRTAHVKGELSV
jgi:hypothetical protein